MNDHVRVYRDRAGRWRWHRVAPNNRVVSDSGQGYRTRWGCVRAVRNKMPGLEIRFVPEHVAP